MGKKERREMLQALEGYIKANYVDVLRADQRAQLSSPNPSFETEHDPGRKSRVESVIQAATELFQKAWKAPPTNTCNIPSRAKGELRHLYQMVCYIADRLEQIDRTQRRKHTPEFAAAQKLHDFLELWIQQLEEGKNPVVFFALATENATDLDARKNTAKLDVENVETLSGAGFVAQTESASTPESIGRISPTVREYASVGSFPFWAKQDADLTLGELIAAENRSGDVKLIAAVHDLGRASSFESSIQHFAAHDLGKPDAELATEPLYPLLGQAAVIHRSDGRAAPPGGAWPIRSATKFEAETAINNEIPQEWRVPAGFVPLRDDQHAVAYLDLRYIAGPEGGHVNIAGISGVAAKTSYALFLLSGLLAWSRKPESGGGLATVMFNVKEEDLMHLHVDEDTWAETLKRARKRPGLLNQSAQMYETLRHILHPPALYPILEHPLDTDEAGVVYLAPLRPDGNGPHTAVGGDNRELVKPFQFDLADLGDHWHAAFEAEDMDDKFIGAILEAEYKAKGGGKQDLTFRGLEEAVNELYADATKKTGNSRKSTTHIATWRKLKQRLNIIKHDLSGLIAISGGKKADYPDLQHLVKRGRVLVFDVTQLSDRARRVLLTWVVEKLERILTERKAKVGTLDGRSDEKTPSRVVVFADELNRFAPRSGRTEVGRLLGRIAAQGRSYGLALVGMQQQASRIEEQVLTNCSTFAVGRSHSSELNRGDTYAWMNKGLKSQVTSLPKGRMVVTHPVWGQPLILHFPLPHHRLIEEANSAGE